MIRNVALCDAAAIADIYNYYIQNTTITFEETPVSPEEMERRISAVTAKYPWLVDEENGRITGYCYASRYAERSAYRYTADISIYIDKDCRKHGTGTLLFERIISECKKIGMHALISIITTPNEPSWAIHEKMGFKKIGDMTEVGFKFGNRIGVSYWEYVFAEK
jgi:phosphinothricin acetyltransferase